MNKEQIIEQLESLKENSEYSITEDSDPIWEKDVKALNAAIKIIKNVDSNKEIYKKAISKYGLYAQIDMVFEEMSELQKELCKFKRGKSNISNIAEEIADVKIMLEQMELAFDIKDKVKFEKDLKIKRLEERIEEE
ncbi:nucleoside triphosphate pyrophosphohydrolase (endogenous virus) [Clostridium phage phiCTC2B]|uniref:NTP pyrophosphohydrolase MazG putative catalytic core domain-containing protein n=1 Tax=Clostridium tetani (strain Massachusetts / E88) TaxID=212717 RepID=Q892F8_CLOTE|nr:hypothetical protein [Clostridium tetani]YP_009276913.1 nucleoside triphosphate pyrophosphohydrolase [Clostridium phage phiCT19406B]YP_009277357.1 nucleoside triphosphate pyrophosphohydrolase [Clostridium phage phiCTC2B]AAO36637.1 hypothetical protein CTC_02141 [Clostridium tetani E88]AJA42773.1 hypothetical protein phiCT19406B_16 [Clostridium phage phiCT19406B]AJA42969.1 hypothetical protein phiCTC2B_16 [Clostridium phage phiCTC2B]SKA20121.1 hypothetical protein SAMN02745112_02844 [Clostr